MGIRRRPDDLDRLLDRVAAGEDPEATGDLAPLLRPARLARAAFVRAVPAGVAEAHLAALRREPIRTTVVARGRGPRRGLRVAVVGLAGAMVLTLGAGSAIAFSSSALPGDPLYGVKRATERVSLVLHRDPVGRAALHLGFAGRRLEELQALLALGRDTGGASRDYVAALGNAEGEALEAQALGRDVEALLAHIQEQIAKHVARLNEVLGQVPSQAQEAIRRAIDRAQTARDNVLRGRLGAPGQSGERGKPDFVPGPPETPPGQSGEAPGPP